MGMSVEYKPGAGKGVGVDMTTVLAPAVASATTTHSTVDGLIESAKEEGIEAFETASDAIKALSLFNAATASVVYTPPQFTGAIDTGGYSTHGYVGGWGTGGTPSSGINPSAPNLTFTPTIPGIELPTASAPGYELQSSISDVGGIDTSGAPTAPADAAIDVPAFVSTGGTLGAANLPDIGALPTFDVVMPTLAEIALPTLTLPTYTFDTPLPNVDTNIPNIAHAPALPWLVGENLRMLEGGTGAYQLISGILERAKAAANAVSRVSTRALDNRGGLTPSAAIQAMIASAREHDSLDAAGYDREAAVTLAQWVSDSYSAATQHCLEIQGYLSDVHIKLARHVFDAHALSANGMVQLIEASVLAYNAIAMEATKEAAVAKARIQEAHARIAAFKATAAIESSKQKINEASASALRAQVNAEASKASVFDAEESAFQSMVAEYGARAMAVNVAGDAARSKLGQFRNKIETYIAGLSVFETEYSTYSAKSRGIVARNTAKSAQIRAGNALMGLSAVENDVIATETEGEALKKISENILRGIDAQNAVNKNQLAIGINEATVAEFNQSVAELEVSNHAEDIGISIAQSNASLAATYTREVSRAATKAAELTMAAITASTKANVAATEAAGKAGATVAAAAYSAMHITAGLGAHATISGGEGYSYSDGLHINQSQGYTTSHKV